MIALTETSSSLSFMGAAAGLPVDKRTPLLERMAARLRLIGIGRATTDGELAAKRGRAGALGSLQRAGAHRARHFCGRAIFRIIPFNNGQGMLPTGYEVR